jgi:serine phosphatase RsbU (regulator of sigma subunit)/anti-sigma regulatory factor (Ser/Thr protein kinase)
VRHAERHILDAIQRVTDRALAYLSEDELLSELLLRITEILDADTAAILLLEENGRMLRARAARGIEEEVEQRVRIPVGTGFAGRVVAERRAVAIDDLDRADIVNPILREKGLRSLLGVPLLIGDRVLGVLHVGSLTGRAFSEQDRDLLQLAADRAAVAIEHAHIYGQERLARSAAEAATRRMLALQRITDASLAYLPLDDLLKELLDRITEIVGTDTAAILLLEENGEMLRARAARGIEEEVEQGVRIPVGGGFAGRIAAERHAVAIHDVDHAEILNPILREKGIRSLLGVPLLIGGRVLGVLHVGSLTQRLFSDDERDLLQLAADRAAIAIEHAFLFEQRRIAEVLQRQLLPGDLRGLPGIEIASRYLPASGESLGGDWYDAFALDGRRIAVVVGDVVGHGLGAAAVMAQLRTALRSYAAEGYPPAAVVERVNGLMAALGPAAMTTLAYALIDPEQETVEIVNAGHPPPLLIRRDGGSDYVPLTGGIPLGAAPTFRYRSAVHEFEMGAAIVLYTDGLVESRSRAIDDGLQRLRELGGSPAAGVEALCSQVVEGMVPEERADDIAIIAARVPPPPDELSGSWPAERTALADVRHDLRRWLRAQGAGADETYEITVACQEACANAVEHAYRPGREAFEVEATYRDGVVRVIVRDRGRWRPPRGTNRGRGLLLMEAMMERVDVRHTEDGTQVVLERTLRRRAA